MPGKPALIIGYGNPSRGDDALGPRLLERLEALRDADSDLDCFDTLTDFQLQIEHAMDLHGYSQVIFVDAAVNLARSFRFELLQPSRDDSYTTHALNPAAVLAVYAEFYSEPPPESYLLSMQAERFELGEGLSRTAGQALDEALAFLATHLMQSMSPV
jgi:hydrogenase maturation protease